jgi:hypothetical protein
MHPETQMFLRIVFGTMGHFDWPITKNILNPTPSKEMNHLNVFFLHLHLHGVCVCVCVCVYIYIYMCFNMAFTFT